jgi:hypothetical protein
MFATSNQAVHSKYHSALLLNAINLSVGRSPALRDRAHRPRPSLFLSHICFFAIARMTRPRYLFFSRVASFYVLPLPLPPSSSPTVHHSAIVRHPSSVQPKPLCHHRSRLCRPPFLPVDLPSPYSHLPCASPCLPFLSLSFSLPRLPLSLTPSTSVQAKTWWTVHPTHPPFDLITSPASSFNTTLRSR